MLENVFKKIIEFEAQKKGGGFLVSIQFFKKKIQVNQKMKIRKKKGTKKKKKPPVLH